MMRVLKNWHDLAPKSRATAARIKVDPLSSLSLSFSLGSFSFPSVLISISSVSITLSYEVLFSRLSDVLCEGAMGQQERSKRKWQI